MPRGHSLRAMREYAITPAALAARSAPMAAGSSRKGVWAVTDSPWRAAPNACRGVAPKLAVRIAAMQPFPNRGIAATATMDALGQEVVVRSAGAKATVRSACSAPSAASPRKSIQTPIFRSSKSLWNHSKASSISARPLFYRTAMKSSTKRPGILCCSITM